MSEVKKCKDCIWLDLNDKKKAIGYRCTNPNIDRSNKHRYAAYKVTSTPACKRGFKGFDGQTIGTKKQLTYQQGRKDAISDFGTFLRMGVMSRLNCSNKEIGPYIKHTDLISIIVDLEADEGIEYGK